MTEINPHPALKAAVPESPMVDTWMGDDDFHNGAFRQPSCDYFLGMSTGKGDASQDRARSGRRLHGYLEAGSAGDFARKWGIDQCPFVRKVMDNPAYTDFWQLQAVDKWFAARPLKVPTMLEVGQWDQEDSYGASGGLSGAQGPLRGHRPAPPRRSARGGTRAPITMATSSAT